MLTIPESLLLLALDDDKGTVVSSTSGTLNSGLAGAILAELAIRERIKLKDEKVVVVDETPTGDDRIDEILTQVIDSRKPKSAQSWIEGMQTQMGKMRQDMLHGLVAKGVLQEKEQKVLWLFTRNTYPTEQEAPELTIRKRVHASLFEKEKPDARTVMLLSLIKACNLVSEVFSKEERKEAKKQIDRIEENNDYGKEINASIEAMQGAIIAACAAIVVV